MTFASKRYDRTRFDAHEEVPYLLGREGMGRRQQNVQRGPLQIRGKFIDWSSGSVSVKKHCCNDLTATMPVFARALVGVPSKPKTASDARNIVVMITTSLTFCIPRMVTDMTPARVVNEGSAHFRCSTQCCRTARQRKNIRSSIRRSPQLEPC